MSKEEYELVSCLPAFCSLLGVAEKCMIFWSTCEDKSRMNNHGRFFFPHDFTSGFQSLSLFLFSPERAHGEPSGSCSHKSHASKTHDFN